MAESDIRTVAIAVDGGSGGEGWITLGSVDKALEHRAVGSLPGCRLIDGHLLASGN